MRLLPKQEEAIFSAANNIAYGGAWGAGKTTALCIWAKTRADINDNLVLIGRKTYDELRDTTQTEFFNLFPALVPYHNKNENATYLPNKTTILWRHLDEWHKLANLNLGAFAIDQAEEIDEQCFIALQGRLRRKVKARQSFIAFNPEGHNWIWKLFKENSSTTNHLIETTSFDNPYLPEDYFERLKLLPENVIKRYVFGSWTAFEGLVYQDFIESECVINPIEIPQTWEKGFVLDHGFRNPTAVLWYAVDFDGTIYIFDEHYEAEKPISFHADEIKKRNMLIGLCDPSIFNKTMSKGSYIYSIADEYRDNGISLNPAYRSQEDASINRVNSNFKSGRLKIFKNCVHTIDECSTWKWKSVKPSYDRNIPEEPEDKGNHTCDCIKYLCASRPTSATLPEPVPVKKRNTVWLLQKEALKQNRSFE